MTRHSDQIVHWIVLSLYGIVAASLIAAAITVAAILIRRRHEDDDWAPIADETAETITHTGITAETVEAFTTALATETGTFPVRRADIAALQGATVAVPVLDRHEIEFRAVKTRLSHQWTRKLAEVDADFERALRQFGCGDDEVRALTALSTGGRLDVTGSWTEADQQELDELLAAEGAVR